jgi:hypothetical protein
MAPGPVLQGVSFFPRGGSAQVVRYLTAALVQAGWTPRIVAGSVGGTGNPGHAATFFAGLPVAAADFTPALDAWLRGEDPLDQPVPLHASYEDKPGAPDRVLAGVSPELAARQVDSWRRLLVRLRPLAPVVLHLHHLTPLHDAAEGVWPDVPVVTHLHGTELLMLEQIEQYSSLSGEEAQPDDDAGQDDDDEGATPGPTAGLPRHVTRLPSPPMRTTPCCCPT